MALEIDQNLFKWVVIAIILMCLVSGAGIMYKFTGGFAFLNSGDNGEKEYYASSGYIENNDAPLGYKQYTWTYGDEEMSIDVNVPGDVYQDYAYGIDGTIYPDNITEYIISSGDDGVVSDTAGQLSAIIKSKDYSDEEDVTGLVFSFVGSIPYETDYESGHSSEYPRTPAVILSDGAGDSGDHSILAAALLRELGYGVAIVYYPPESFDEQTVIPEAVALGLISNDSRQRPVYPVSNEDGTEIITVSPFWTVDTTEKGYPSSAFYSISPEIYPDDSLWCGIPYNPGGKFRADFGKDLDYQSELLSSDIIRSHPLTYPDWLEQTYDYYQTVWYPSGVSWELDDKWRLYDKLLDITGQPRLLYTPWGFAEANTSTPWRITFRITDMDPLRSDKEMTPYSDVLLVLYEKDQDTGKLTLADKTGWQTLYDSDFYRIAGPYPPGKYVLGIFVKNAGVDVSLEYSGKVTTTNYQGPI
ncbi:hypothetical protein Mpet_2220 [Methanolacinia petrolearia DSM 11571]|uniref:Uncharacterized protein n=1 Tax=Methanolacinia petrolearia (strain DSM 11571 / OCM 486 / SEBR 4847) TaxID=679926 RepID=E1RKM9_METP4|nr:hypothetical protein [Methanolacinia petrolearia]ADN36968.1 hypothetical protein Mpet_2220 [Methanolacinia petrolearia DSM 11571]